MRVVAVLSIGEVNLVSMFNLTEEFVIYPSLCMAGIGAGLG